MTKKEYTRDKRSPKPKDEIVSRVMSANKASNTKPEMLLRKELWKNGLKGYRIHYKKAPGKPDIAFVSKKIAIFVHGCFWHRCPKCNYKLPKNNPEFWKNKFETNAKRDRLRIEQLENAGWVVNTIWECDILNNIENIIHELQQKVKL